jgi:uncharacterized protein
MSLIQTIQTEITIALKSGDRKKLETLRFIVSQAKYKQIETQKELTDDDMIMVIRKQIKELTEAADQFKAGNRNDLVSENEDQIEILKKYLPLEISDEELSTRVRSFITENKSLFDANPRTLTGKVVGALKSKASPDRIVKQYNSMLAQSGK